MNMKHRPHLWQEKRFGEWTPLYFCPGDEAKVKMPTPPPGPQADPSMWTKLY